MSQADSGNPEGTPGSEPGAPDGLDSGYPTGSIPAPEATGPMGFADQFPTGEIPAVDGTIQDTSDVGMMRSSAIMAMGSIISRITGVLRDTALTAALGLYVVRDAFALGNSLPNTVYTLVIGGALNAVFVPQLVRKMRANRDGGKAYADALLSAAGTVLLVLSVLSVIAAPFLVHLYASSTYTDEQMSLAVAFARYCLPQIFFYGIYTMLSQVLNARGHFGMPMFAPIVNNLVAIMVYVLFIVAVGTSAAESGYLSPEATAWLGIGTSIGVAAQALILIPVVTRTGYRYSFTTKWRGLGLGKAARLAGWTIGLVLANQVSWIVITRLATRANINALELGQPPAGLATYQTANLIFMLPHGVITVSIVTALLPALSRTVDAGRLREAGGDIARSARTILLLIAPLGVAMFTLASPAAAVMFGYGAAEQQQVQQLAIVTQVFALGLPPFTIYYVLLRGWYAFEDTRTPFFLALLLNAINVVLAIFFFYQVEPGAPQVNALAFAYILTYWIITATAWPILARRYGTLQTGRTLWTFGRIGVASLAGLAGAIGSQWLFGSYLVGDSKLSAIWTMIYVGLAILICYSAAAWLLRIKETQVIAEMVSARLPGRRH